MKNDDTVKNYKQIALNIKTIRTKRTEILKRHFPEITEPPVNIIEDMEKQIQDIIGREIIHSSIFLASALGFTKSNWNRTIEKMLIDLGLGQKFKCPTYKNMLRFEKLKHLIFKYLDKKK